MRALKKRLNHKNPNVQLLALGVRVLSTLFSFSSMLTRLCPQLTDICIKNGGDHFLVEIASREFMDNLSSMLKMQTLNLDVKEKLLRYIQTWAIATDGKPSLSYVSQTYRSLKGEGAPILFMTIFRTPTPTYSACIRLHLPAGRPQSREQGYGRHADCTRMD